MKRVLNIVLKSVLAAGIIMLFIFANKKQDAVICPQFNIELDYNGADPLISRFYIRQLVTEKGIKVKGQPIGNIELEEIHKAISQSPFVKNVNLTMDINGKLKAVVTQRNPIVRVIDRNGLQFYIDSEGKRLPISHEFTARVLIANGKIESENKTDPENATRNSKERYKNLPPDLQKIFLVAKSLNKNKFTKALAEQIYINSSGETEIIPKIGDHTILLGDTTSIEEKLEKLKIYYTAGNSPEIWTKYHQINLKYKDQVICKKNNK
ncbi:MAG: hypothetical protein K0B15_03215 [Lentimicrobium sp.]|nr:hypothetical protein [Lentimicrobium sp.]